MKDLVSKLTFGFFMAQLVPGGLSVLALFMLVTAIQHPGFEALRTLADYCLTTAFSSVPASILSLGTSVAFGMLLHGVNWAAIGYGEVIHKTIFDSKWHSRRLFVQVLLAPFQIISECWMLAVGAKSIPQAGIRENVVKLGSDRMQQFQFLQDFYLHFAQFYAHASYALLVAFAAQAGLLFVMGTTLWRLILAAATYLLAGMYFVLGRIQFYSLFRAELDILDEIEAGRANKTAEAPTRPKTETEAGSAVSQPQLEI